MGRPTGAAREGRCEWGRGRGRACLGEGGYRACFQSGPLSVGGGGGVGAAKGLLSCFLVPKGNQPTACTLALWWLKFGPTGPGGIGGGGIWRASPPSKGKPAPHPKPKARFLWGKMMF